MSRREDKPELSHEQAKEMIKKAVSMIDLFDYIDKSRAAIPENEKDKEALEKEIISKLEGQRQDFVDLCHSVTSGFGKYYIQPKGAYKKAYDAFKSYLNNEGSKINPAALLATLLKSEEVKKADVISDSESQKLQSMATAAFGDLGIEITTGSKIFVTTKMHPEPIAIPEDLHLNTNATHLLKPTFEDVLDNLDGLGKVGLVLVPSPSHFKNFDSTNILDVVATNFAAGIRTIDTTMQDIKENGLEGIRGGLTGLEVAAIIFIVGAVLLITGAAIAAAARCFGSTWTSPACTAATILMFFGAVVMAIGVIGACIFGGCVIVITGAGAAGAGAGSLVFPIRPLVP